MFRIAFTGSSYVGKTTLVNMLYGHFRKQIPAFTDIPDHIKTLKPGSFQWTTALQNILEEIYQLPAFISDRSFVCRLSFEMLRPTEGPPVNRGPRFSITTHERLEDRARQYLQVQAVKLIYVPIEFEGEVRDDPKPLLVDRLDWDKRIRNLLAVHTVPYLQVHGTPEDRLVQILEYIGL